MLFRKSTGLFLLGMLLVAAGGALVVGQETQKKELKKVPVPYSKPTEGAQMYKDYCAACHGKEGTGDGPAVEFLKAPPPDLRTLAQRNNGKYPAEKVAATLRFGPGTHAHGTLEMPIWGPLFHAVGGRDVAQLRIHNLNAFVESLQPK
jgi:mono/diheme cytochrome c family protein